MSVATRDVLVDVLFTETLERVVRVAREPLLCPVERKIETRADRALGLDDPLVVVADPRAQELARELLVDSAAKHATDLELSSRLGDVALTSLVLLVGLFDRVVAILSDKSPTNRRAQTSLTFTTTTLELSAHVVVDANDATHESTDASSAIHSSSTFV